MTVFSSTIGIGLPMSQSLHYLSDNNVDIYIYEKQALKKQLVSELVCARKMSLFDSIQGNFCQVLLLNFHCKEAPSP